jgi:selenide,water dikinase
MGGQTFPVTITSYGQEVRLSPELPAWAQRLLCDPQTSGGLLVACAPEAVAGVLDCFHADGFTEAAVIGALESGHPQIGVE